MADTPVTTNLLQALDVHRDLTPQITFNPIVSTNDFAQTADFRLRQIFDPRVGVNARLAQDIPASRPTNAIDVSQSDFNSLVSGQVNSSNSSHLSPPRESTQSPIYSAYSALRLPLSLLVLRIFADHAHHAPALDDLALGTAFLN
jgi:hypothetical protein